MSEINNDMSISHVYTSLNQIPVLDGMPSKWSAKIIFISLGFGILCAFACLSWYGLIAIGPCYILMKKSLKSIYQKDEYALKVFSRSYSYSKHFYNTGRIDSEDRSY